MAKISRRISVLGFIFVNLTYFLIPAKAEFNVQIPLSEVLRIEQELYPESLPLALTATQGIDEVQVSSEVFDPASQRILKRDYRCSTLLLPYIDCYAEGLNLVFSPVQLNAPFRNVFQSAVQQIFRTLRFQFDDLMVESATLTSQEEAVRGIAHVIKPSGHPASIKFSCPLNDGTVSCALNQL